MSHKKQVVAIVGSTGAGLSELPLGAIMRKELDVVGSLNGDAADYAKAIAFLRASADRMPWDELFSPPRGLSGTTEALESMIAAGAVKPAIDPRLP